jgi:four helix bundle protein
VVKINSFEDLLVWQKARILVRRMYLITSKFPREEKFGLIDQIRRAVVSVMANIAEGFSRYHLTETVMFYRTARGSLTEVKSHLFIALDLGYISRRDFEGLVVVIDEIGKMINGLIKSTNRFRS